MRLPNLLATKNGRLTAFFLLYVTEGIPLGSVSYTHLRAHETVLDLVCRLLLEKKKNTTQYVEFYNLYNKQ